MACNQTHRTSFHLHGDHLPACLRPKSAAIPKSFAQPMGVPRDHERLLQTERYRVFLRWRHIQNQEFTMQVFATKSRFGVLWPRISHGESGTALRKGGL